MTVLDTISKLQESDEGTARVLLEMALFGAVCDEADRVRPYLERDVAKALSEKAAQSLRILARQPISKASIELADQLVDLVEIAKRDEEHPRWDAAKHPRDPDSGEFIPKNGRVRQFIANALGIATAKPAEPGKVGDALGSWVGPQSDKYSRMRSLGQGLVSTNDPRARPAGTVLRLMGDIGPEAQKALEPGIRRTAYRYRGTERRPDPKAQEEIAALVQHLQGPGQDQRRLQMTSDFGAKMLIGQIPNKDTAAISLAAGKMPPSVGLMFDSHGRLVSEAQGFNGDHYLPFDLRNLKRLKGGSYVRTRTTGGLTDEDIYTGLMTGARHMTVVSNSGVFTLEFAPDLRGGRRYSDKARQMVERYGALVNAIGSGQLYQNKLPQEQIKTIREESLKAAGGNAEAAKPIYQRRLHEAQEAAAFVGMDDDELMEQAERDVRGGPPGQGTYASQVRDRFNALRAEQDKTTARKFRLDGEGYKAAMQALKTEFPYYIRRATYLPLQEYGQSRRLHGFEPGTPRRPRGGADMGYTEPGGLQPNNAGVPNDKGGRTILGARRRTTAEPTTAAPTGGGAPQQGQGQQAPLGAPKATLSQQVEDARKAAVGPLYTALGESMTARTRDFQESWMEPLMTDENGAPVTIQGALGYPADQFAKWYLNKHDGDWAKVAQALPNEPAPVLDKWLEASQAVRRVVASGGEQAKERYPDEAFNALDEKLKQLRMLAEPFAPGKADLTLEPPVGMLNPQAVPEVLAIEPDPDKIREWTHLEGNEKAGQIAAQWQAEMDAGKRDDAAIRRDIANKAARIRMLKQVAAGQSPVGIDAEDPNIKTEAADLVAQQGNSPQERELADMHRAWALLRYAQVVGATRGTGAAVPFDRPAEPGQKEVGKRGSTPSRVVAHRPGSPVAKALGEALAQRRALHHVRL